MSSAIDDLPPPPGAQASGIDDLPPPTAAPGFSGVVQGFKDRGISGAWDAMKANKAAYDERMAIPGNAPVGDDVPLAIPAGALGSVGAGLVKLGQARGLGYAAARTGLAGVGGAVQGAVQPADSSEERKMNALKGAAIGMGSQGLAEGVGGIVNAIGDAPAAMENKAEERAFKSSGAMLKDYRKAAGQDRINELGRYMIDNDLTKAGMTFKDVAEGADALNAKHGAAIGDILDQLDQAGAAAPTHADLASKIEAQAAPLAGMNTAQPTYNALQDVAADIRTMGKESQGGSFNGAQKVKEFISDQIDKTGGWTAPNPSEKNLALRDAYRMVNGEIESAAGKAAESVGDKELLNRYTAEKAGYRNSLELAKIAKDQALRQNANRFFSPSDMFTGGMGAVAGFSQGDTLEERLKHAAQGAALGFANKAVRTYGTPLVSTGLDWGASALRGTGIPAAARAISPIVKAPVAIAGMSAIGGGGQAPAEVAKNQGDANRLPASGPDRWARQGIQTLGLQDDMAARVLADPKGKQLLIQASSFAPNSKAAKKIMDQINAKWGSK